MSTPEKYLCATPIETPSTPPSPPLPSPSLAEERKNNNHLPFSPRQRDTCGPFKSSASPLSDLSNISEPDSLPEVSSYLAALEQLERDAVGSIGWSSDEESSSEEEDLSESEESEGEKERREEESEVMRRMIAMIRIKLVPGERLERVEEESEDEE